MSRIRYGIYSEKTCYDSPNGGYTKQTAAVEAARRIAQSTRQIITVLVFDLDTDNPGKFVISVGPKRRRL